MLKIANAKHQRVYLLGSKNEIIEAAERKLNLKYPNVTLHIITVTSI